MRPNRHVPTWVFAGTCQEKGARAASGTTGRGGAAAAASSSCQAVSWPISGSTKNSQRVCPGLGSWRRVHRPTDSICGVGKKVGGGRSALLSSSPLLSLDGVDAAAAVAAARERERGGRERERRRAGPSPSSRSESPRLRNSPHQNRVPLPPAHWSSPPTTEIHVHTHRADRSRGRLPSLFSLSLPAPLFLLQPPFSLLPPSPQRERVSLCVPKREKTRPRRRKRLIAIRAPA